MTLYVSRFIYVCAHVGAIRLSLYIIFILKGVDNVPTYGRTYIM
jgi:hypothetical protein